MSDDLLYYEDFEPGVENTFGPYEMSADLIRDFAAEWDPQPFHLDEELANNSVLGGLCASGWHVCSIMNRMMIDAYAGRSAGMGSFGVEEVKWIKPVYADDQLMMHYKVLDKRVSAKRPEMGIIRMCWQMFDQHSTLKTEMTGVNLFKVRDVVEAG